MSGELKENSHGGSKNKVNKDAYDPELVTPCPLCGENGAYKKFLRFDLLNHLRKDHTKKELAGFVTREAHFSRWWDMDEETCKQKHFDSIMDLEFHILQCLKEKGPNYCRD